jgi:DNA transformation protein
MFGGWGIFCEGLMSGLIADEMLYLKVDNESRVLFEEEGLPAFEYTKGAKVVRMSFHLAPDCVFGNQHDAYTWATRALESARRSKK